VKFLRCHPAVSADLCSCLVDAEGREVSVATRVSHEAQKKDVPITMSGSSRPWCRRIESATVDGLAEGCTQEERS